MYFTPFLQKRHCVCSRVPGGPTRLLRVCRNPATPDFGLPRCGTPLLIGFLFCVLTIFCPVIVLRISYCVLRKSYCRATQYASRTTQYDIKMGYHLHRHCWDTVFLFEDRRRLHFVRRDASQRALFVRHLASAHRGGTESFQL